MPAFEIKTLNVGSVFPIVHGKKTTVTRFNLLEKYHLTVLTRFKHKIKICILTKKSIASSADAS